MVQRHFFGFISILLLVPFMNSHVKYATNRKSATSPAKNPITSKQHSVTSSGRRQHSSGAGPCRSSSTLWRQISTAAHRFFQVQAAQCFFQNYISQFWGVYTLISGPAPSNGLRPCLSWTPVVTPFVQGIFFKFKIQNFNFFDVSTTFLMPSSGRTKGLNYRVQRSCATRAEMLLLRKQDRLQFQIPASPLYFKFI